MSEATALAPPRPARGPGARWLLVRLLLVLPLLVGCVLVRRLRGLLPGRWTLPFAVAVEVVRYLIARMMRPLLEGAKLDLPAPRLRGRLARATERRPGRLGGCAAEWLSPKGPAPAPCVLYLHGGAFVTGSIGTHRAIMARLAHAAGARVVGIEYRLAPEHRFPAGLEDCVAAYRELLEAGEPPARLVIAGDSAGGGLAASTLLALKQRGLPLPAAAWLLSPAVDLADARPSWARNAGWDYLSPLADSVATLVPVYLGPGADAATPLASPLRGDLAGLPPLLIHVGEKEVLHDQVVEFADRARAAGVDVTLVVGADMVHVYPAFLGLVPEASEAFAAAGAFVRTHTGG